MIFLFPRWDMLIPWRVSGRNFLNSGTFMTYQTRSWEAQPAPSSLFLLERGQHCALAGRAFFFARHPSSEVSECVTASPTGFSPQPVISTRFCHRSPRSWPCFQSWVTFHQFHLFHPTQTRVSQEIPKTHTHRIHVRYGFITHIWLIFCNKCVIA